MEPSTCGHPLRGSGMKVVAIISQKGGVGKTTIAVHLAVAAVQAGYTVALVDLDPQATAAQWSDWRGGENPAVVAAPHARLTPTLKEAAESGVDLVIIDSPPAADSAAVAAAKAADLVIIPTRASAFDLHAIRTTADLVKVASKPGFALLNAVPPRATALIEEVATVIYSLGLSLVPLCLVERAAFRHAVLNGQTASEFDSDSKAATEVQNLYKWMCGQLHMSERPPVAQSKKAHA